MLYISIDLETTGLDSENHQILTFSAVLEDTTKKLSFEECPKLNIYLLRDEIVGSPFAINMNSKIISSISSYQTLKTSEERKEIMISLRGIFLDPSSLPFYFYIWCLVHHEGKDYSSLLSHENWQDKKTSELSIKKIAEIKNLNGSITVNVAGKNFATFDKKFIDKVEKLNTLVRFRQRILDPSVLFTDWTNDDFLPDLAKCKERAGIDGIVTHDSLLDAWDVIALFRNFY